MTSEEFSNAWPALLGMPREILMMVGEHLFPGGIILFVDPRFELAANAKDLYKVHFFGPSKQGVGALSLRKLDYDWTLIGKTCSVYLDHYEDLDLGQLPYGIHKWLPKIEVTSRYPTIVPLDLFPRLETIIVEHVHMITVAYHAKAITILWEDDDTYMINRLIQKAIEKRQSHVNTDVFKHYLSLPTKYVEGTKRRRCLLKLWVTQPEDASSSNDRGLEVLYDLAQKKIVAKTLCQFATVHATRQTIAGFKPVSLEVEQVAELHGGGTARVLRIDHTSQEVPHMGFVKKKLLMATPPPPNVIKPWIDVPSQSPPANSAIFWADTGSAWLKRLELT